MLIFLLLGLVIVLILEVVIFQEEIAEAQSPIMIQIFLPCLSNLGYMALMTPANI